METLLSIYLTKSNVHFKKYFDLSDCNSMSVFYILIIRISVDNIIKMSGTINISKQHGNKCS